MWHRLRRAKSELEAIRELNKESIERLDDEKQQRVDIDTRLKAISVELDVMARKHLEQDHKAS